MKKIIILFLLIAFTFVVSNAEQTDNIKDIWKFKLNISGSVNQGSYSNWQQSSGTNSFVWTLGVLSLLEMDNPSLYLRNKLKTEYGETKQGDDISKKALDRFELESILNFKSEYLVFQPFLKIDTKTQYNVFLDPVILAESVGVGKDFLPGFNIKIGITAREIFVNSQVRFTEDYSTPQIEKFKFQLGIGSVLEYESKWTSNMIFNSKLEIFSPYLFKFANVKMFWDNDLIFKCTDVIHVKFVLLIAYDEDWSKDFQMYENLNLGLVFNIF